MMEPAKHVLICALPQEISVFVKGWREQSIPGFGPKGSLKIWRSGVVAACAIGTGPERSQSSTKVVIEALRPELVTSIGFTGSVTAQLGVRTLFVPAQVIASKTGTRYPTVGGDGVLVTSESVAGASQKQEFAQRFAAQAVDMEAAGVAEAAKQSGTRFAALKVVSDDPQDRIDFVGSFVSPEGFRTGAFLVHIAVRPWLWGAVRRLASNSATASRVLADALREYVAAPEEFLARHSTASLVQGQAQQGRK